MNHATEVKNVYIPVEVKNTGNSISPQYWLIFKYSADDKIPPYKWPKVLKYNGGFFMWMSYNSDSMHINYKEIPENLIAFK